MQEFKYPVAHQDNVTENYHGTSVADPYRWLEDPESPQTLEWAKAENRITQNFLKNIPARELIKARLTVLWNYPRYSVPTKKGNYYFFSKNDGLQNQAVVYRQEALDDEPAVLLDPNEFSEDGTIALVNQTFSEDGTLLAYGASSSGSDWQEIRIRKVATGEDFSEVIQWTKFTSIGWKHDNSGFYYGRFPEPGSVPAEDQINFSKVYFHRIGTPQSQDVLVYERPDDKELTFQPFVSDDGQYLLLRVFRGTEPKNRLYYREIGSDEAAPFVRLLDGADASYTFIGNRGPLFYIQTDYEAPNQRIIAIDIGNPARENWQELIAEQTDSLAFAMPINQQLVLVYLHDVHHEIKLFGLDGSPAGEIALPTLGSITGLSGELNDSEMFLSFASYLYPTTIFRYDFAKAELNVFRAPETKFDASGYITKQVFFTSKDGTRVPMFLTHKKGLELNGDNPTLLFGYGGFNISLMPDFAPSRLAWIEQDGIFAVANLRGGSEYGEKWHLDGMLEKKQNVFDDFIAAAEWLINNKYTSSEKLAIEGGSNGGLLVAACMLQRPDLYGAVICRVPVIDMLRYHKFTVGRYWTTEYGNAETNADHFKFMYAYSPLHNVKAGVVYPPLLIATADTDDRVVPAHAKKFAATLQAAANYKSQNPLLIRIEQKAGHGLGKPTSKLIEEMSDIYAFLFRHFEME